MCKAPLIIAKTQQDVHQDWILPAQLDVEIDTFGAFQERFASPQKLQNFGKQFFFDNLSQPQGAAAGRQALHEQQDPLACILIGLDQRDEFPEKLHSRVHLLIIQFSPFGQIAFFTASRKIFRFEESLMNIRSWNLEPMISELPFVFGFALYSP